MLEEKKIPYQYIEVNPYHKEESLLKLNPRGLVPTLQYDNKPLYESTVICEFLEEAYPDHGPKLLPEDVYERARTRIWTDFVTSRIIPAFHRFLQFQPISDKEGLEEKRQEFLSKLKEFVNEMHLQGPFFLGSQPSLVDFVIAPWIVSTALTPMDEHNLTLSTHRCDYGFLTIIKRAWELLRMILPGIVSAGIRRHWKRVKVFRIR